MRVGAEWQCVDVSSGDVSMEWASACKGHFVSFFFQIILHVKRGVVSRRFENVQYPGSRQRSIATERFRSLPLTKVVRAYNKLGAISWRTAFGPKSNFYMGLRDIPVPPGGRRCGNNGADHGPMELTATVIPRSRRSRYTHIYMSLLYYRKWRPNGPRASTTSGIAHLE